MLVYISFHAALSLATLVGTSSGAFCPPEHFPWRKREREKKKLCDI